MRYKPWAWMLTTIVILAFGLVLAPTFGAEGRAVAPADSTEAKRTAPVLWRDADEALLKAAPAERLIVPRHYRFLALDLPAVGRLLASAPVEGTVDLRKSPLVLPIPLPNGATGRFAVVESSIMEPALQAKHPETRTYLGQGLDDPTATVRLDLTPVGFHAMILSGTAGAVFVDPYRRGDPTHYISYFKRDFVKPGAEKWRCWRDEAFKSLDGKAPALPPGLYVASGTQLRTYRAAVAADGEYTQFHGGTVAQAHAAQVTTMNRVVGVYEREVAIRMVLVANNDNLIYTNPSTDPYTNDDAEALLAENQSNCDAVIGNANYDIGHVFGTGGGGLASLNVPCVTGVKARGETGSGSPVGDPYDIDYVAHEMGHQWGGEHTFNGTTGNCGGGNRSASAAYEPGSGSTIQAYAGICGAEDLQPHSDPYFHTYSFDQIVAYSTAGDGNSCAVVTATGNNPPTVNAGSAHTIPAQTPFTLTGSATDPDADALTYCWEQMDLGTEAPPNTDDGSRPLFRSFNPTTSPSRTFPQLADILNNTATFGESMATTSRTMNFRLTARDNRAGGGGVNYASTTVTTVGSAGPFRVTSPGAVVWGGGTIQLLTWDVAGTTAAPISCSFVNFRLSTDGGLTFPITLANNVPNDGSENIFVPEVDTTTARIKIEAANNIFFAISYPNFSICTPNCSAAGAPTFGALPLTVNFTATASGTGCTGTPFFSWDFGDGTGANGASPSHVYTTEGTFNWTCYAALNGAVCTKTGSITTCAAATVTVEPVGPTICTGQTATLSLTAAGTAPLNYQWQQSPDGVGSWTDAGATNPWTTPPLTQTTWYRCTLTNACGADTSDVVPVTVNVPPVVTAPPVDATICSGQTTPLSVGVTGSAPLSYQWQQSPDGVGTWTNAGVGNPWTTPPLAQTTWFRCVVSNTCGADTSGVAQITVNYAPTITTPPANATICHGETTTLAVSATGTAPLSYQWQQSPDGVGAWADVPGAIATPWTTPALLTTSFYRCRVTNSCGVADSAACTVTVLPLTEVTDIAFPLSVCSGSPVAVTVTGLVGAPPYTYNWYWSADGVNFTQYPTAHASSLHLASLVARTVFKVEVTGTCGSDERIVIVEVINPPTLTLQPANVVVRSHENTTLQLNYTGTEPVAIQWFIGQAGDVSAPVPGATKAVFQTYPLTVDTPFWARVINSCGQVDTQTALVSVLNTYFLSHVVSTTDWWSRLNLVSADRNTQPVLMEVFNATGLLVENAELPGGLAPRCAFQADLETLFSPGALSGDVWMRIVSKADLKGVVEWGTRNGQARTAMPLESRGQRELAFPYIYESPQTGGSYYTGITLVNTAEEEATVILKAFSEAGGVLGEKSVILPPRGKFARLVRLVFPEVADPLAIRSLRVHSTKELTGFEMFGNWTEMGVAGVPAIGVMQNVPKDWYFGMYLNQVPPNDGWYIGLALLNMDPKPATVMADVYGEAGNKLGYEIIPLAPSQQLSREAWEIFDPAVYTGAANFLFGAYEQITGLEIILSRRLPFAFDGLAGIPQGGNVLYFPLSPGASEAHTIVLLTNQSTAEETVLVEAFAADGTDVGFRVEPLPGNGQLMFEPALWFPAPAQPVAWIKVVSVGTLAGSAFINGLGEEWIVMYPALVGVAGY